MSSGISLSNANHEIGVPFAPESIIKKLDPRRFPNISPRMVALIGFFLGKTYTDPMITELKSCKPLLLIATTRDPMFNEFVAISDVKRNFQELFKDVDVGLTGKEKVWAYLRLQEILG